MQIIMQKSKVYFYVFLPNILSIFTTKTSIRATHSLSRPCASFELNLTSCVN